MPSRSIRNFALAIALFFVPVCSFGQTYTIETFAGGGLPENIPATTANIGAVSGVAVDAQNNLFVSLSDYNVVMRVDAATGNLTRVAGFGTPGFSGDGGPAKSAELNHPTGLAIDRNGDVYILDESNFRVRKVSGGVITTVAGIGWKGGTYYIEAYENIPATEAWIIPNAIAIDAKGELYIAEAQRVSKVAGGIITMVAGGGSALGEGGPARNARISRAAGVAVDKTGNVYIVDSGYRRIRRVADGVITTVAGIGTTDDPYSCDPKPYVPPRVPVAGSELYGPGAISVDATGNIYFAEYCISRVRVISNGFINTFAGNGDSGYNGDNQPATDARLYGPLGLAVDGLGALYIADTYGYRVRKVSNGIIATVAGTYTYGDVGDGQPATEARLSSPAGVAVSDSGAVFVSDAGNHRVRVVSNGLIGAFAGNGYPGQTADNVAARDTSLDRPRGIALDRSGALYIADTNNRRIRKVSSGVISTVAGNGTAGDSGDGGPAKLAQLYIPMAVAADYAGSVYAADFIGKIRKISEGAINTIAGNGTTGSSGDNGSATSAQLWYPNGVAVDKAGNVYIADTNNNRIRKVFNGIITNFAGSGYPGFAGDGGPAQEARLHLPRGVAVDSVGNVYIADTGNNRIRKVSNGVIETIAGNGAAGSGGDGGPALGGALRYPEALAVDRRGNVYVADTGNSRIRLLTSSTPLCSYDGSVIGQAAHR